MIKTSISKENFAVNVYFFDKKQHILQFCKIKYLKKKDIYSIYFENKNYKNNSS